MKLVSIAAATTLCVALVGVPGPVSMAQTGPALASMPTVVAPELTSIGNFRDVAGIGVPLSGGATMTTGVVYRSGQLKGLSEADTAAVAYLGLTAVLDLRSSGSAKANPDPVLPGAPATVYDVFAGNHSSYKGRTAAGARAYMRAMNRAFVTDAAQRRNIAKVLNAIAGASGPVLIHCAAGKDRTGWVSAVLQRIAGADRATIVAEYRLSNVYRKGYIDAAIAKALTISKTKAAIVKELQLSRGSYIEAGLNKASAQYGSFHRYLTRGLKLSTATIAALRAKLRQA